MTTTVLLPSKLLFYAQMLNCPKSDEDQDGT